ncbi:TPA: hypothetical protein ACP47P_005031 [Klebsiella pneumoniae]
MGEISVKTGNNARNGGKNSLNRLIRCVCGKKIGPDPRNFNQRVSLGRNDLLIRTFPSEDPNFEYPDNFLHLENIKVRCDNGQMGPLGNAMLRVKIDEIDGHFIGNIV